MHPERLLADPPLLHVDPATGERVAWHCDTAVLRRLAALLPPDATTMETGAGLSTLWFAAHGCRHTAIAPDAALMERIDSTGRELGIDMAPVTLVAARSEVWLPHAPRHELDLFLIDGRHGFPSPMVDWFFGAERLKIGGHIAVDDTQLLACRILADFLHTDRHWGDAEEVGRTAIFRKLDHGIHDDEWGAQPLQRDWRAPRRGRIGAWLGRFGRAWR